MRSQKRERETKNMYLEASVNTMTKNNSSIFVNLLFDDHLTSNNIVSRENVYSLNF